MPYCYKCGHGPKATAEMKKSTKDRPHPLVKGQRMPLYFCFNKSECRTREKERITSRVLGDGVSKPTTVH